VVFRLSVVISLRCWCRLVISLGVWLGNSICVGCGLNVMVMEVVLSLWVCLMICDSMVWWFVCILLKLLSVVIDVLRLVGMLVRLF